MVICGSVKKITMVTSCIKTHVIRQKLKEYDMVPVAMETFGSWVPSGLKFLKDIGARIALATGEKKSSNLPLPGNIGGLPEGKHH